MSDDMGMHAVEEPVIRIDQQWELRNWSRWLGCTEEQLRHAIDSVGPDPDNVRRFLRQAR